MSYVTEQRGQEKTLAESIMTNILTGGSHQRKINSKSKQ
jgi:hypothetical protein